MEFENSRTGVSGKFLAGSFCCPFYIRREPTILDSFLDSGLHANTAVTLAVIVCRVGKVIFIELGALDSVFRA